MGEEAGSIFLQGGMYSIKALSIFTDTGEVTKVACWRATLQKPQFIVLPANAFTGSFKYNFKKFDTCYKNLADK